MRFSQLPEETRVKLEDEAREELWHRVDEFGGVKQLSESFGYSASRMYNWKSKESFIPVELVRKVFGNEAGDEVAAIKGRGRGKSIENPDFPLDISDELLTRVKVSVNVNSKGTPIYQTQDRGNAERFIRLLEELGDSVPYRFYSRSSYEIQYPKFLQQLFNQCGFEIDKAALADEKGSIENGEMILPKERLPLERFQGELHNRDLRLQLALALDDEEEVQKLMSEEVRRTRSML